MIDLIKVKPNNANENNILDIIKDILRYFDEDNLDDLDDLDRFNTNPKFIRVRNFSKVL